MEQYRKEIQRVHSKKLKATRETIKEALSNRNRRQAIERAKNYAIWKANNFLPQWHAAKRQGAIYDVLTEQGFVKLDKIINKDVIKHVILPECMEYIAHNEDNGIEWSVNPIKYWREESHNIARRHTAIDFGPFTTALLKPFVREIFPRLQYAQTTLLRTTGRPSKQWKDLPKHVDLPRDKRILWKEHLKNKDKDKVPVALILALTKMKLNTYKGESTDGPRKRIPDVRTLEPGTIFIMVSNFEHASTATPYADKDVY